MAFELTYGYFHCIGKTLYSAGIVRTKEEARQWVFEKQRGLGTRLVAPKIDPVRCCPVKHCHMKLQKPWFSYRATRKNLD